MHHLLRVAQGRHRLDVERKRGALSPFVLAAQADVGHLELVLQAINVHSGDVDGLVGTFEHGQVLPAVIGAHLNVLDDTQRHVKVDVGHGLGQPGKVLDVVIVGAPSLAAVGVDGERRVRARTKIDRILVQLHLVLAVGADDHHFARQRGQRLVHQPGRDLDQAVVLLGVFYNRATFVGNLDALLIVYADARLVQDRQG